MKKFERQNRKIHIGKAQRPDLKLMVCDKGPGLSKETDNKVLEKLWCGHHICSLDLLMLIDHNWHWLIATNAK